MLQRHSSGSGVNGAPTRKRSGVRQYHVNSVNNSVPSNGMMTVEERYGKTSFQRCKQSSVSYTEYLLHGLRNKKKAFQRIRTNRRDGLNTPGKGASSIILDTGG